MNRFEKSLGPEDRLHRSILNYIKLQYPKVVVAHPPNGGKRTPFQQYQVRELGISQGLPDILVFSPGKRYRGLAIEVKAGKNKPTEHQLQWMNNLWSCGWMAVWTNDFDKAKAHIDQYFNGDQV